MRAPTRRATLGVAYGRLQARRDNTVSPNKCSPRGLDCMCISPAVERVHSRAIESVAPKQNAPTSRVWLRKRTLKSSMQCISRLIAGATLGARSLILPRWRVTSTSRLEKETSDQSQPDNGRYRARVPSMRRRALESRAWAAPARLYSKCCSRLSRATSGSRRVRAPNARIAFVCICTRAYERFHAARGSITVSHLSLSVRFDNCIRLVGSSTRDRNERQRAATTPSMSLAVRGLSSPPLERPLPTLESEIVPCLPIPNASG